VEQRINSWIGGLDGLSESYESTLDNLERTVNKLQAESNRRTLDEQWQRVTVIHQKNEAMISSLVKGELPTTPASETE